MEGQISLPIKIMVWVLLITLMIIPASIFVQQLNTSSNFESNAVAILQREGGTTKEALTQINKMSKNTYHGMYEVQAVNGDTKPHDFGEKIKYKLIQKYSLRLFSSENVIYTTSKIQYTTSQIAIPTDNTSSLQNDFRTSIVTGLLGGYHGDLLQEITEVHFTSTPIPKDKISSAIKLNRITTLNNVYAYVDGTILYISPESSGVKIILPPDCDTFMGYFAPNATKVVFDNIDTSQVTNFHTAFMGMRQLKTIVGFDKFNFSKADDLAGFFDHAINLNMSITVDRTWLNLTDRSFRGFFSGTATESGAKVTVNYVDDETKALAQKILATKTDDANVVLGMKVNK